MKISKTLLPLFALVLGIGLVFSQSAFKPAKVDKEWGMVHNLDETITYIDLDSYSYQDPENPLGSQQYTCDLAPAENCTAFFDVSVTPGPTTPDPANGRSGELRTNP
ncbi:MAG: hypothetical protein EOO09_22560 [Chitinophagaceae bacterium]|nr:MAG: hypothetical protein EOO09_22560 [Chitinophagaceae bacterium]